MIDVKVTVANALSPPEKGMLVPLLSVGQVVARQLLTRVPKGKNARGGNFGEYVREPKRVTFFSKRKGEMVTEDIGVSPSVRRRVRMQYESGRAPRYAMRWIPPDLPQPERNKIADWRGWAGYATYGAWKAGLGRDTRNFVMSGALFNAMTVKGLNPVKVRVTFSGQHPVIWAMRDKISNLKLAKILFKREAVDPMLISNAEMAHLMKYIETVLPASYLDAQAVGMLAFRAKRALRKAQRTLAEEKRIFKHSKAAAKWSKP